MFERVLPADGRRLIGNPAIADSASATVATAATIFRFALIACSPPFSAPCLTAYMLFAFPTRTVFRLLRTFEIMSYA